MSNQPRIRIRATKRLKGMACEQCGSTVQVGSRRKAAVLCLECRIDRMSECATEMYHRSGPYYDKWVQGMIEAIRKAY